MERFSEVATARGASIGDTALARVASPHAQNRLPRETRLNCEEEPCDDLKIGLHLLTQFGGSIQTMGTLACTGSAPAGHTNRRALVRLCAIGGLLAALLHGSVAAAQQAEGFALDRFEPAEHGSDWFAAESLDLRGHTRFAAGLVLDYGHKPLVLYDANGDELTAIVRSQLFGHVGGGVILWDRLRLSLNLPVAVFQDGDSGSSGGVTFSSENATTVGDLRLSADVRLAGAYHDPVTLAAGIRLYAPTGSRDSFTGDGAFRGVARLMGAGKVSAFVYSAGLGFDFRAQDDDFAGSPRGSEVMFGAAAGLSLVDDRLVVGPEIYGSTVVTDADAVFARRTTPFELIVGGHYRVADAWSLGAGVGPGLTRAFGTPQWRALASLTWFEPHEEAPPLTPPPPPPGDRDGDGIVDPEDACPDQPGPKTDDPATNGCPPPDRDGDKIIDPKDACPDDPGPATSDPKTNGCPPPGDRDGDGIVDPEDACPDEPGIRTEDPKTNGCPDTDRDRDTILNDVDACPDAAGPADEDPKKNGCPAARVERGQIMILEQVQFAYNSDRILKASDPILEAVKAILVATPDIKKVEVQGHTDSKGGDAFNKNLSLRRAKAVAKWLVDHGIDKARFDAKGFGEERPIADNATEEGRAANRRVEFHIVDQGESGGQPAAAPVGQPAPAAPAKPAAPAESKDLK